MFSFSLMNVRERVKRIMVEPFLLVEGTDNFMKKRGECLYLTGSEMEDWV